MFIGHFALGFAAKRWAPGVSLALLFSAAQLADLLWPILVALGLEQVRIDPGNTAFTPLDFISYPYSHSLVTLTVFGILLGFGYAAVRRSSTAVAAILAALVVSHWILDYVTHRPDMPLYPGSAKFGLGLWRSVPATIVVESAMYVAALFVYATSTRASDAVGRWGFVGLAALLALSYVANVMGGAPPSVSAIVVVGLIGGAVTIVLSWWIDRHRAPTVYEGNRGERRA